MRDLYIEQDGILFMKCEPEPLKKDTPMPCIAELIYDSSPMGIYNKARSSVQVCGMARGINKQYPQFEYLDWEHNEYMHWSRYNVVAKHCPEGSIEWALWQMMQGEMVCHKTSRWDWYRMYNDHAIQNRTAGCLPRVSAWLESTVQSGWQIYKEPKPAQHPNEKVMLIPKTTHAKIDLYLLLHNLTDFGCEVVLYRLRNASAQDIKEGNPRIILKADMHNGRCKVDITFRPGNISMWFDIPEDYYMHLKRFRKKTIRLEAVKKESHDGN